MKVLRGLSEWTHKAMVLVGREDDREDDHADEHDCGCYDDGDDQLHENEKSWAHGFRVSDLNDHGPRGSDHGAHGQRR